MFPLARSKLSMTPSMARLTFCTVWSSLRKAASRASSWSIPLPCARSVLDVLDLDRVRRGGGGESGSPSDSWRRCISSVGAIVGSMVTGHGGGKQITWVAASLCWRNALSHPRFNAERVGRSFLEVGKLKRKFTNSTCKFKFSF